MALFRNDVNPIPSKPASKPASPSLLGMPPSQHLDEHTLPAKAGKQDTRGDADAKPSESRLIVGPNIKLKGVEIEDCDTLVVEGYVEASMDSRVIEISETGVYKGTVEIDIAIIKGRFEGDLTARERLIVHATGDVKGKIRYGRLAIDEGGRIHGDLDELGTASKPKSDKNEAGKDEDGPATAAAE